MGNGHWGLAATVLCGAMWTSAAQAADWRFCSAGVLDPLNGRVHLAASGPFEVTGIQDWHARLMSARTFEVELATVTGLRDDALLDAVAVACTEALPDRAAAQAQGQAFKAGLKDGKRNGIPARLASWPDPLPRDAASTRHVAPALDFRGRHASAATRASSPGHWGLSADDLSSLHGRALLRKAGLPGRQAEVARAAAQGDAYAQFLAALRPPGEADDLAMLRKAADQGLVRAASTLHDDLLGEPGADRQEGLRELRRLADLGSAHALYAWAMNVAEGGDAAEEGEVERALLASARLGYAPAQFEFGQQLARISLKETWRDGREWLRKAAAQGLPEATDLLEAYPPEPAK